MKKMLILLFLFSISSCDFKVDRDAESISCFIKSQKKPIIAMRGQHSGNLTLISSDGQVLTILECATILPDTIK